jgi:tight adherence protein B
MDTLSYWFVIVGFFAAVLFVEGIFLLWNAHRGPAARRIAQRLESIAGSGVAAEISLAKKRRLAKYPAVARLLERLPHVAVLDRMLLQSGLRANLATILGLTLALGAGGWLAAGIAGLPWFGQGICTVAGALLPVLYVRRARHRRMTTIEAQMPDGLDLMARAMRAGHAFPSALQMVGEEMPEPIAGEFKAAFDEINFGIPVKDALLNLAARVPSSDVHYFVVAVLVQRETGGNLAELLGNIGTLIRARLKMFGAIRVLSAEGKLSAIILTLLPFALAAVVSLVNPGFLKVLWTDPAGIKLVWTAAAMMILGIYWMRKLIRIRI